MRIRDRGFALVLVLIAVVGVFALAMQGAVMSRAATIESRVMRERAEAERAARSAALVVLLGLAGGNSDDADTGGVGRGGNNTRGAPAGPENGEKPKMELPPIIRELLGDKANDLENQAREQNAQSGGTLRRVADGGGVTGRIDRGGRFATSAKFTLPTGFVDVALWEDENAPRCRVWLSDAAGQLDINSASDDEITRYLRLTLDDPLAAASIADELLDWRDEDSFLRPRGAEQPTYDRLGVECRNGKFASREELLFLPSMTRAIFERIKDDLSLDGDGKVHAGTASREVLASLPGMTPDVVDSIVRLRSEGALTDGSLEAALPLLAEDAKARLRARPSTVVRIRVEVRRGKTDNEVVAFDGLAVAGDQGVRALGLRPL